MTLDPETKDMRAQWRRETANKRREEKLAEEQKLQAEGDGVYSGASTIEQDALESDWKKLTTLARLKFPAQLAIKYDLTPLQRSVAVAHCLGWSQAKIAEAGNVSAGTVSKYINQNDTVKAFIDAFSYHNAGKPAKDLIDTEQYSSLQVIKEIRDDTSVSATTRLDAAKWIWEQKHGKAKEAKEIRGVNLRELTAELSKLNADDIIEEVVDTKKN